MRRSTHIGTDLAIGNPPQAEQPGTRSIDLDAYFGHFNSQLAVSLADLNQREAPAADTLAGPLDTATNTADVRHLAPHPRDEWGTAAPSGNAPLITAHRNSANRPPVIEPRGSAFDMIPGAGDHAPAPATEPTAEVVRPAERAAQRPWSRHLASAALGFICGVFTWHAVGFWTFMRDVTFNHDPAARHGEVGNASSGKANEHPSTIQTNGDVGRVFTTGSLPDAGRDGQKSTHNTAADCVALVRDARSGKTTPKACPALSRPLRDAGRHGRRDRAADASARMRSPTVWASTTDVAATEVSAASHAQQTVKLPAQAAGQRVTLEANAALWDDESLITLSPIGGSGN